MLLVFNTTTGRRTAEMPLCGDADDLFVDREHKHVIAICGEGVVQVLRELDADHYESIGRSSDTWQYQSSIAPKRTVYLARIPTARCERS